MALELVAGVANDYFFVHASRPVSEALIRLAGAAGTEPRVMPQRCGGTVSLPGGWRASGLRGPAGELRGRRSECDVLGQLVNAARAGESRALVVRGEPGVGKTALLDYLAEHASGCRVARAVGVESEMELAYAGVHQLRRRCWTASSGSRVRSGRRCGPRSASALGRAGPLPGWAGRAEPAVGGGRGTPTGLPGGGRTVAGPRVGPGPWVRGPPPGGRVGRPGVRGPRAQRRAGRVAGAGGRGVPEADARELLEAALPGRWTRGSATESSPRPVATRWRYWSCPGG